MKAHFGREESAHGWMKLRKGKYDSCRQQLEEEKEIMLEESVEDTREVLALCIPEQVSSKISNFVLEAKYPPFHPHCLPNCQVKM